METTAEVIQTVPDFSKEETISPTAMVNTPVEELEQPVINQPPDWKETLKESIRGHSALKEFGTVEELTKAFLEVKEGAAPKLAADYKWEVPEGLEVNEEIDGEFKELAKEIGLNNDQFQKLQDFTYNKYKELDLIPDEAELQAAAEKEYEENMEILKKEWGDQLDERIDKIKYAVTKELGPDGISMFENAGLANNAGVLKMLSKLADHLTEDSYHIGGKSTNLSNAQSQLDAIYAGGPDSAFFDESHMDHQRTVKKVTELFEELYNQ